MSHPFRLELQPHPFRLLLMLEWVLLGLAAFKLFGFPGWNQPLSMQNVGWLSSSPLQPIHALWQAGLLLVFGMMGLRFPTSRWVKWLYVMITFGLLLAIATVQGWALDSLSPLLIVVVLRSALIFGRTNRWIVAGLMWSAYPLTLAPVLLVLWAALDFAAIQEWSSTPNSGVVILPTGDIQINASFGSEEVRQFFDLSRNFILYVLLDNLLSFGLVMVFVLLLVNSLINERQGRRKLAIAHEQLYQYSLQIEDQATLQERTRIARDIHDSLGHLLTAQSVVLENTALSLKTNLRDAEAFLEDGQRLGAEARRELRQAILMLRSDPLQGKSLEAAIAHLIQDFNPITGITPTLQIDIPISLPNRYQVAVYRIVEEALTNIQKHSEASQVEVKLELQSETPDKTLFLALQIADNGQGFKLHQNQTGFGLQGMRERTESLGGELHINTQSGCCITVLLPLLGR